MVEEGGWRGELDGDQRPAEGVEGELDASIGPGTNGEGNEIQRGEVKLKEETENGGEVCRLLSSWGCPWPHFGWSQGRRGTEEMGLGGGLIGGEKKIECSLALGAAYEARGWRPRAATSVSA
jgi:hypothetical protein